MSNKLEPNMVETVHTGESNLQKVILLFSHFKMTITMKLNLPGYTIEITHLMVNLDHW